MKTVFLAIVMMFMLCVSGVYAEEDQERDITKEDVDRLVEEFNQKIERQKFILKRKKLAEEKRKKAEEKEKLSHQNLNNRFDSIEANTKKYNKYVNAFARIYKRRPNSLEIGWFDNGSAEVTKEMTEQLMGLVNGFTTEISKGKKVHMRFEGFSDIKGGTKRNYIISKQRAEAVKKVVQEYIKRKDIKNIILGEAIGKGSTEEKEQTQKYNRFVRIFFKYQI